MSPHTQVPGLIKFSSCFPLGTRSEEVERPKSFPRVAVRVGVRKLWKWGRSALSHAEAGDNEL